MVRAGLYLPPGMTVDQYFLPPYSVDEIFRLSIFHLQVVTADAIMVCTLLTCSLTWHRSPFITGVPHVPYL